jgi:hypothetical protein
LLLVLLATAAAEVALVLLEEEKEPCPFKSVFSEELNLKESVEGRRRGFCFKDSATWTAETVDDDVVDDVVVDGEFAKAAEGAT